MQGKDPKVEKIIKQLEKGKDVEEIVAESFPHLLDELSEKDHAEVKIDALRQDEKMATIETDELRNPDTISFIRRCDTIDQAKEIIQFQLKCGELTEEQAKRLLDQLEHEGLRSFGSKKEYGYYENKFPRKKKDSS